MVWQRTVTPPTSVITGSIPVTSTNLIDVKQVLWYK